MRTYHQGQDIFVQHLLNDHIAERKKLIINLNIGRMFRLGEFKFSIFPGVFQY
jgi:hypothetical protein